MSLKRLTTILALLLASAAAPAQTPAGQPTAIKKRTMYEDLQMFTQVLNQLRVNHPDSLDPHTLIIAAIQGMLSAADPHSFVITGYRFSDEKEKALRERKLFPVPIIFRMVDGAPVVISVAAGSSAAWDDISVGDELVAIDGAAVNVESSFELNILLAGAKNSTVRLSFLRRRADGTYVSLDRNVRREWVSETSAVTAFMLNAHTGYVRVTTFENSRAADDLHSALGKLEGQGMDQVVLDLRDNGGGLVREAAAAAGEFLPKNSIVYTIAGRKQDVVDTGRVSRSFWSREKRYAIVVMINNGTASAAELVAGALQDYDRAVIVGQRSFGKSLAMREFPLSEGSVAVMVVGQIRTPCGRVIQREYRGESRRSYYHMSGFERDSAERPSCKTSGGRTVYGGGGIVPDIAFPSRAPIPDWVHDVTGESLMLKWVSGHVAAAGNAYRSLDDVIAKPSAAPGAVESFRKFASDQNVSIPKDPEADSMLEGAILMSVVRIKWGEEGTYRLSAAFDPEVKAAVGAFARSATILRTP